MRMSEDTETEKVKCGECGASNMLVFSYSHFPPANTEYEEAHCYRCGKRVARRRCLSVYAKADPDDPVEAQ